MFTELCYKICNKIGFVDYYERKRTREDLTDNRPNPPQTTQWTTEEWFKNGIQINHTDLPPRNRTIRQATTNTIHWDVFMLENRVKNEHSRLDIAYKVKNIVFAAVVASIPVAYLIGQGINRLAELF